MAGVQPANSSLEWSTTEVGQWLTSVGHADLVASFQRLNLTGHDLARLDDDYIRTQLGISDDFKRRGLVEALHGLQQRSAASAGGPSVTGQTGRKEGPRGAQLRRIQTMPAVLANTERPRSNLGSEPMLGISAQELMLDGCSNCGWIRKQGGNVRNCESKRTKVPRPVHFQ